MKTADIACDKLMRLRSNRVLYGAPAAYCGIGRPRKHGDKFKLNDPTSWWQPDEEQPVEDERWGQLRLQIWHKLHLRQAAMFGDNYLNRIESNDLTDYKIATQG